MNVLKEAKQFGALVFLLLGILFGMIIMAFIFGNLGPENSGAAVGSQAYNTSLAIQNNSLNAIEDYSGQSSTQFTVAAVAITLIVLIALFGVFWVAFMGRKGKGNSDSGMGNFGG